MIYKMQDFHNQNLLLDTNILIYQLNGQLDLSDYLIEAKKLFVSAITVSELYAGVDEDSLKPLQEYLAEFSVIPVSDAVASLAGGYKTVLGKKGQAIGLKDLLIAATAQTHDLKLVSANKKDFAGLLTKKPVWIEV